MLRQTSTAGKRYRRVGLVRLLAAAGLAPACVLLGFTAPAVAAPGLGAAQGGHGSGYQVSPVTEVSTCGGYNAEVEQAVAPPHYVYEAWIGCGGEGFARSTDGGLHFSNPIMLPDSASSRSTFTDDPAVAVAPDGTLYVSWIRYAKHHAYPQVATSFDHGATFPQVRSLIPKKNGNWADRDFIAAGRGGTVYVTEDYGPSIADVKVVCSPSGSCAYGAVDATAVVQKSTDHGKTWGPITPMQPGFPAGGGYDASTLVQPNGVIDALMIDHPLNPRTFKVHPGHELFTRSSDGGKTWSPAVEVGGSAGTLSDTEWWIDGDLSTDRAGNLYATWDTQSASGDSDIGWLSFSTDHGQTWSAPLRVTPDQDSAVHNVEVVGTRAGRAVVAWQADNSPQGYATYLRPFSITRGWLAPVLQVSPQFGHVKDWPGDTFGLSASGPKRVVLSWGSAVGTSQNSEIYESVLRLP
jgi:BNR/Asp-box repeat